MAYNLRYSDYSTGSGPPDPARWVGPQGPPGPVGPQGPKGAPGDVPEAPLDGTVYGRNGAAATWTGVLPLSGGTVTGSLNWTSTGTTTSRAAQDRSAEVVNVKDFGAIGDGVADDTAAINAAMDYVRAHPLGGTSPGIDAQAYRVKFLIPPGRYLVTGTLNWTGLASLTLYIEAGGAIIVGRTAGKPVVDALSSRWLHIHGLTIQGDTTNPPNIGLQLGRQNGQSADLHHLDTCTFAGYFTFCALYNMASEGVTYTHLNAWNQYPTGPNVFVVVLDGIDYWNAQSQFLPDQPSHCDDV